MPLCQRKSSRKSRRHLTRSDDNGGRLLVTAHFNLRSALRLLDRWFATGEICLYLFSLSAAVTLVSALPFGRMNLTPRQASSWFWPMRFQISAFAGFHSS